MKVTRFLLSVLFLGAMASTASAQSAQITWDSCTNLVANKAIAPGTTANLYVSCTGLNQPHNAYQSWMLFGSGNFGPLRDAWRFDTDGCQTDALISIGFSNAALAKSCPTMTGASSLQIKNYTYDPLTGKAQALLASTYSPVTPNAALRYMMVQYSFNHLFSVVGPTTPGVDCGGLEVPVCGHLIQNKTSWLWAADNSEHVFPLVTEWVTSNDPSNTVGCPGVTPAAATTWGSIKGQYRR